MAEQRMHLRGSQAYDYALPNGKRGHTEARTRCGRREASVDRVTNDRDAVTCRKCVKEKANG